MIYQFLAQKDEINKKNPNFFYTILSKIDEKAYEFSMKDHPRINEGVPTIKNPSNSYHKKIKGLIKKMFAPDEKDKKYYSSNFK